MRQMQNSISVWKPEKDKAYAARQTEHWMSLGVRSLRTRSHENLSSELIASMVLLATERCKLSGEKAEE